MKATELLRGSKSWDGVQMPDYPVGCPELVVMRYEFAAGEKLGWHHHARSETEQRLLHLNGHLALHHKDASRAKHCA